MTDRIAAFNEQRSRLYGIAYRMLGSRADAEDMVQEAYLRWHRADPERIQTPQAWLVTTITRICIDRLRAVRAERAAYVGPWLPEPIESEAPPADAHSELASDLSVAFLVILERLAPEERAAFLLHDVFDSDYHDIAGILGKNETTCRQIVHRARQRVRQDRPRFHVSEEAESPSPRAFCRSVTDGESCRTAVHVFAGCDMDFRRRRQGESRSQDHSGLRTDLAVHDRHLAKVSEAPHPSDPHDQWRTRIGWIREWKAYLGAHDRDGWRENPRRIRRGEPR